MDYIDHVVMVRHAGWAAFAAQSEGRIILLSTKGQQTIHDFTFAPDDILLFGQESAGVPDEVRTACDSAVRIPLRPCVRSLNVAVSAGIALGEALRQTNQLPL